MAYLTRPPAGSGPGIVVGHAWWGANGCFRAICDALAGEGFVVVAPDLYHGYVATTVAEAELGQSRLDREVAISQMRAAAQYLLAADEIAGQQIGSPGPEPFPSCTTTSTNSPCPVR